MPAATVPNQCPLALRDKIHVMIRFLYVVIFLGFSSTLAAQFGLSAHYQQSQDNFITISHPDGNARGNGWEVSADYWFRLPNKRIEFLPTVSYGQYSGTLEVGNSGFVGQQSNAFELTEIGFQFKTNFYLFDFGTDCDCPTWGKQGPALHKGFFVQLAPGVQYIDDSFTPAVEGVGREQDPQLLPSLAAGIGIDFGLSNLLTITPVVSYRHYFGDLAWEAATGTCLNCQEPVPVKEATLGTVQAGIRIGIRLDKRRY